MSANGHGRGDYQQECRGCGKPHDRSFSEWFCSNSCRIVYGIRKRLGLWVPTT